MLPRLTTITKPRDLDHAHELILRGAYPLYGGGASLIRLNDVNITEAVDLSEVVTLDITRHTEETSGAEYYTIGTGVTLETMRAILPIFASLLEVDYPLTLRNALTLGDILLESRSDSLLLTAFAALETDLPQVWSLGRKLVAYINVRAPNALTFNKVARTPSDSPIVGAVKVVTDDDRVITAVCGLDRHPVIYVPGMTSNFNDYKGSAEYRAAMAAHLVDSLNAQAENNTPKGD